MRGKLLLSLSFDPQRSLLKGIVLKAADLKKQDIIGQAGNNTLIHNIVLNADIEYLMNFMILVLIVYYFYV